MQTILTIFPVSRHLLPLMLGLALLPGSLHADWRKDFLRDQGIGLDKASLQKAAQLNQVSDENFKEAFKNLGSNDFQKRVKAQKLLSEAGEGVLDFLDAQEPIQDPEIRFRVAEIRRAHAPGVKTQMAPIVRLAAKSLMDDADSPATGGMFYEWFGTDQKDCGNGYRGFIHEGPKLNKPYVEDGRLRIPGPRGGDINQRLVLPSKQWPGQDVLPDHIQVSCLIGGEVLGAGAWHVAIGVGKVKALIHPGYAGGGFRFEEMDSNTEITPNAKLGFTPLGNQLYRMVLEVQRLPKNKAAYRVTITSPDGERFDASVVVDEAKSGPIDRISLERSGRQGGAGIFDDLQIRILE